jgi:sigma-54 specific flagellar transcriptional regulator A
MSESRILLLDRDTARAERLATLLEFMDFTPRLVDDLADLDLSRARAGDWVAVVAGDIGDDPRWPAFVEWLAAQALHPPVLELPGHADDAPWRASIHAETVWPLAWPVRRTQLQECLRRASLKRIDEDARRDQPQGGPTGRSAATLRLSRMLDQVAPFDTTVLILGESGTGKEVAARAIHERSKRAGKPFVAINCGAIPPDLLESELFGHEKGAFTGASQQKPGRFEVADGGTIFLDEVGEMAASIQAKLLRALQERSFVRVGGTHTIECDVRVIAATNRDLKHEMEGGRFRPDLYYRLNVFPITLPPLRQRAEDLPMLIDHLTNDLSGSVRPIQEDALAALLRYSWPGNIRELRNVIERALLLAGDGAISLRDLPEEVLSTGGGGEPQAPTASSPAAGSESRLVEHEKTLILHALNKTDWNQSAAARELGITRDLLRYRMKKYALKRPQ